MDCFIVYQFLQMLRCFRFALHQKDISGGKSLARGCTPLHEAASWGRVEVVKLLLEAKAWVPFKDNNGRGPRLRDVMGVCLLCGSCLCLLTVETCYGEAVIKGF